MLWLRSARLEGRQAWDWLLLHMYHCTLYNTPLCKHLAHHCTLYKHLCTLHKYHCTLHKVSLYIVQWCIVHCMHNTSLCKNCCASTIAQSLYNAQASFHIVVQPLLCNTPSRLRTSIQRGVTSAVSGVKIKAPRSKVRPGQESYSDQRISIFSRIMMNEQLRHPGRPMKLIQKQRYYQLW